MEMEMVFNGYSLTGFSITIENYVVDKPLSSSTAQQRLKVYLKEAHVAKGETLHSSLS